MIQKYQFVEKNLNMLRKLTKEGYVSSKLLTDYNIYKLYMSVKGNRKFDRYRTVANETGFSTTKVRFAVAEMKKYVKD